MRHCSAGCRPITFTIEGEEKVGDNLTNSMTLRGVDLSASYDFCPRCGKAMEEGAFVEPEEVIDNGNGISRDGKKVCAGEKQ